MKKTFFLFVTVFSLCSCGKLPLDHAPIAHEEGLIKDWIGLQLQLIRNTTGVPHVAYSRHFAYTGLALYGAMVKAQTHYSGEHLIVNHGAVPKPMFAPAAMNAAIASMLRFFYGTRPANLASIDSLESAYVAKYSTTAPAGLDLVASARMGKDFAATIQEMSEDDGASNASIPYTPLGEGYWEPTAPAYASAAVPGWGNNRPIVPGSTDVDCPQPPAFSSDPSSPFYSMVKEVYDVRKTLTPGQKAIASFWGDAPNGKYYTVFGHWFSILRQVLEQQSFPLQKAAKAYLQLGVSMNDAAISCWKTKFTYNQLRPITYIRKYMGEGEWTPFLTTPNHPEYVAAHATISSAGAYALQSVFGNNFHFTDHSYDGIGMQPRNFGSFEAAAKEAGLSRLYGGIHYRFSIEAGSHVGTQVAMKADSVLKLPTLFVLWED